MTERLEIYSPPREMTMREQLERWAKSTDDVRLLQAMEREEFAECDACRAKPGSPPLCAGCLWNRSLIGNLRSAGEVHWASGGRG